MSQATKRKHVVKEVLGNLVTPTESQQIVRVLGSPGNNLHEVVTAQGDRFLVSMPTKFRKNIWIKRGDFVIVDPIAEGEKVKAEISFILYKDHIRQLQAIGIWPDGFSEDSALEERGAQHTQENRRGEEEEDGGMSDSDEDDSDLFVNTNRVNYHYSENEEETEEDEDDDDDEEEEGENGEEEKDIMGGQD
ncbi:hypothetical protein MATL_G00165800 [Megalops atlanticus]|uniref:Probable RNA-binding protein EIF1AD n=1 Tax=Megalops atlanticus TaxID=7932 RepID=A0A9D3T6P9_MEGAT|nr:hypothetical protein MATL_G00165800 [Megalops atlanticus]